MKILITTSTLPRWKDDEMPRFVFDLAKEISRSCRVTVLAPHAPGAPRKEENGALIIRRFQYSWPAKTQALAYGDGMRQNLQASLAARMQMPGYLLALGRAVRARMRRERFDVVNSHWMVPQGVAGAALLGRSSPVAHVVTAHAGDVAFLEKMAIGGHVARFVARRSDLFLPVAGQVEEKLRGLTGSLTPMAVQPMGVDGRRFGAVPLSDGLQLPFDGDSILFVGRLVEKKGLVFLLEALRLMANRSSAPGLVVIGSGALKGRLERDAVRMGLGGRVVFLGALGHDRISQYLRGSAVVALPFIVDQCGETEGMPTVLAEALAAGCKVVASRVGGVPDVLVDGYNGWLAAPGDASDLADKLAEALGYTNTDIQHNARRTGRKLDWSCVAENYLAHFERALTGRHKRVSP